MGKARDRMLVQASLDQISTFAAYAAMGLKKDHRNYENISDICYLLGIKASWIVLTNNPDKVAALRDQGLVVTDTEALEFEPSPFNLAYLTSKAAGGHILKRPIESLLKRALPPEPVKPFRPHALPEARRFIYSASYFLPMKPVDNDILLNEVQFREVFDKQSLERYMTGPTPSSSATASSATTASSSASTPPPSPPTARSTPTTPSSISSPRPTGSASTFTTTS